MKYLRVIPRDFFNESKLLKCFGKLSLAIHENQLPEGIKITISDNGEPFDIQLASSGALYIANYETTINDKMVRFQSTYNSKSSYPFFCVVGYDEVLVFEDNGLFSEEFKQAFAQCELKHNGTIIFTGTEKDCYFKLQKIQSQSADWAIRHEGYTIQPIIL